MELPKNITQIGETNPHCKIYVEDYVISYIRQLNQYAREKGLAVALYGTKREEGEITYLFLYGACKLNFLQRECRHLSQAVCQEVEKLRRKHFAEYEFLGYRLLDGEMIEGFHICEQGVCRYVGGYAQFYEKNAPDAESWLDVTTKALENTVAEVLTNMNKVANKAANKEYGSEDLAVFVEQLKSLRDEFYSTGNLDYAGRYVFTGYRTDTPLTFMKDVEEEPDGFPKYEITEQVTIGSFDTVNCTDIGKLEGLNKNNYDQDPTAPNGVVPVTENDIKNGDVFRLRLSYDNLKAGNLDGQNTPLTITYKKADGTTATVPNITTVSVDQDPYSQMLDDNNKGNVFFVPETGELLFGKDAYNDLVADTTTQTEFQVTYGKTEICVRSTILPAPRRP